MSEALTIRSRDDFAAASIVSRETLERIDRVVETLDDWRGRLNLIGPKEWSNLWARHIWDSAQILPFVNLDADILDLGSGAGFPGLILSAAQTADGGGGCTLVESSVKKCAFLRAAIEAADLRAEVQRTRIETLDPKPVGTVTARALAPLPKLFDYSGPWLARGATGVFHKGASWNEELTAAAEQWTFAHQAIPSRSGGDGVILIITEVSRAR
ncbi:MAG: 16S rRNA (guanine(527)-N(7))-methyltransferase RsmG [Pseudomonadota bacterium]